DKKRPCFDADEKRNDREVRAAVDLAKKHRNVNALVIGNEAIYRHELEPSEEALDPEKQRELQRAVSKPQSADEDKLQVADEDILDPEEMARVAKAGTDKEALRKVREEIGVARLIKILKQVKRESPVPVTTAEVWNVWRDYPDLVSAVDFIAVHILPYWEGRSAATAVDDAIGAYNLLRERYPGKRIVIGEFGWPSGGYNLKSANPGRIEQAQVLREFVARAEALGIDYNIIEATDQPWKVDEGSVGPYWGIFDADRRPKFSWTGPVT